MNVTELYFLVGIFVGGVWGFSVGHQHGPLYGLLGGIVGVTVGLAGAAAVVVSWVGLIVAGGLAYFGLRFGVRRHVS